MTAAKHTTDELFRRQAIDRAALTGLITQDADRPNLLLTEKYERAQPRLRRWAWAVTNTTTGEVLATGRAWTKKAAIRRRWRAYNRVLAELHGS